MGKRKTQGDAPDLGHMAEGLRGLAWPIKDLNVDPRNARSHSEANVAAIAASLRRFGQLKPAVGNRVTGRLEAGHGMMAAARQLGWTHLAVIWVEHSERDARDFGLADNRTAELAEWDEAMLRELVTELKREDLGSSFCEAMLLDELVGPAQACDESPNPEPQIDRREELRQEWQTEPGQIWEIGGASSVHRILCGDSTAETDVTAVLAGVKPLMMITDPPYGVKYDPTWRHAANVSKSSRTGAVLNDERSSWSAAWMLFPGDVAYVWHATTYAAIVERSLQLVGFDIRAEIIWVKQRFAISRGHYHWRHEPCFYAVRRGGNAKWSAGRKANTVWADIVDTYALDRDLYAAKVDEQTVFVFDPSTTTIWDIAARDGTPNTVHGTQKPLECMQRPMRNHGDNGDGVYDPFLGSGTSILAAEYCGRVCYGIELDPCYMAVILQRMQDAGLSVRRTQ